MRLTTPTLSAEAFHERWRSVTLTERASYQQHFLDVCRLVGAPTPAEHDPSGEEFAFEYGLKKTDGRQGYADVYYRGHFAIEYKGAGRYKDLSDAYRQLLQYRENLNNPPLLVVCDIDRWELRTNFTNAPTTLHTIAHADIAKPRSRDLLRRMFTDPGSFHPEKNKLQITEDVAAQFRDVVDDTLDWRNDPERVARFMTRLVFCMFVEDIGLLPKRAYDGILTEIIRTTRLRADAQETFPRYIGELFTAMAHGGNVQMLDIPYFNGSLFDAGAADIVPLGRAALSALDRATDRDWSHVEPTIFGTIFERTLEPKKRGQLGAHYTHPDDIRLIVEPVLMAPLRRGWETAQAEAAPLRERLLAAGTTAERMAAEAALRAARDAALAPVRAVRVLDPACGSGNFLYISLRLLLDLEKEIVTHPLWAGLPDGRIEVSPTQLYGIEINEIAHALASVVVWIGYLQWRYENGYFEVREPILSRMADNIRRMDAILTHDADGNPAEPEWPEVDVIIGNPPFLGDKRMRGELGSEYVDTLRGLYDGRVAGGADLVTYWFEKARAQTEKKQAKRAGLLSTNSIRMGANREVLERIKKSGDIFMAWADRPWVLDGAAVRVSMVGFDDGSEKDKQLNGNAALFINSDLTAHADVSSAKPLGENGGLCFLGMMKAGAFDIDEPLAMQMLAAKNASGLSNSDVVKPRIAGQDVTDRPRPIWIIDFGVDMTEEEARRYELPFKHVEMYVKPVRETNNRARMRIKWWLHGEARPGLRKAIKGLGRFIATSEVSKYRTFVWVESGTIPDHTLHVIARDDDYFFGVLQSSLHEAWSLKIGSYLGVGNDPRYSSSRTFETFPFPFPPGKEDFDDPRVAAISAAAKALHEERHAWLHPPGGADDLRERTLTNLYNALALIPQPLLPQGEGESDGVTVPTPAQTSPAAAGNARAARLKAAVAFAPRLAQLHDALDRAVCAAYGWDPAILADEEAMLAALLALNGVRAGQQAADADG